MFREVKPVLVLLLGDNAPLEVRLNLIKPCVHAGMPCRIPFGTKRGRLRRDDVLKRVYGDVLRALGLPARAIKRVRPAARLRPGTRAHPDDVVVVSLRVVVGPVLQLTEEEEVSVTGLEFRGSVIDRLNELARAPFGANRDGIIHLPGVVWVAEKDPINMNARVRKESRLHALVDWVNEECIRCRSHGTHDDQVGLFDKLFSGERWKHGRHVLNE